MKKFLISFMVLIILLSSTAYAAENPYTISIKSDKDSTLAGTGLKYTATVTNDQNMTERIDLSLKGSSYTSWVTLNDYSMNLDSYESQKTTFFITPPFGTPVGKYLFRFKAESHDDSSKYITKDVNIYVIEVARIELTSFTTDKDTYSIGEDVTLTSTVKNTGTGATKNATLEITLEGTKEESITKTIPPLEVEQEYVVSHEFTFDSHADGGSFKLTGTLTDSKGEEVVTEEKAFTIESKAIIRQSRNEKSSLLEKTITLTASNDGNKADTATITEDKSSFTPVVEFVGQTPETKDVNGNTAYVWTCELEPLGTCSVSYTVKYWPYLIVAFLIIIVVFMVTRVADLPEIKKTFRKGTLRTVNIEIKNRSKSQLKDVQIQDFVPRIFKVAPEDISMKPAMIKSKTAGTQLVWNLGKLAPGDERIISYKLRPVLGFEGTVNLPPVKLIAKTNRNKERKATSIGISVS